MNFIDLITQIFGSLFSSGSTPIPAPVTSAKKTIKVTRTNSSPTAGIFGVITLDWDSWVGASLENYTLVIPAGTYNLVWHISPHLGNARVPMLVGVPGRTEILLHWGNTENCSEGCILCGLMKDGNDIDSTQTACQQLFAKIDAIGIENVQIIVQ